jgi:hypothetical protein
MTVEPRPSGAMRSRETERVQHMEKGETQMSSKKLQSLKPLKPKALVSPATEDAANTDSPAVRIRGAGAVMQDPKKTRLGRKL